MLMLCLVASLVLSWYQLVVFLWLHLAHFGLRTSEWSVQLPFGHLSDYCFAGDLSSEQIARVRQKRLYVAPFSELILAIIASNTEGQSESLNRTATKFKLFERPGTVHLA